LVEIGYLSWMASHRRPITDFQRIIGIHAWKYADLSGKYEDVLSTSRGVLERLCVPGSVGEYGIPGTLVGETRATLLTWGSEILVLVERLDPGVTRVQVLSRPVVPVNFIDFGANKRLVAAFLDKLLPGFALLAEG
jgi:hypothetical protein